MQKNISYQLNSPSRLHFTLIDMNGESGRIHGGVGLTLDSPSYNIIFRKEGSTRIITPNSMWDCMVTRAINYAAKIFRVKPSVYFELLEVIPPHQGFGSGTQLRLACLNILKIIHELEYGNNELINISGRGGTSGIGVHSFFSGGFIIDGGHKNQNDQIIFLPSKYSKNLPPPLLFRYNFPKRWKIICVLSENHSGLYNKSEKKFMISNTPIDKREVHEVTHILLMRMLPAIVERDFDSFCNSVDELQGIGWKKKHWCRSDIKPLERVRELLFKIGIHGVGLSSTGSCIYGFFEDAGGNTGVKETAVRNVFKEEGIKISFLSIANANNDGFELKQL